MRPVKNDPVEISQPALEYSKQSNGAVLSPRAFAHIDLLHSNATLNVIVAPLRKRGNDAKTYSF
jgi:hypothetical protein